MGKVTKNNKKPEFKIVITKDWNDIDYKIEVWDSLVFAEFITYWLIWTWIKLMNQVWVSKESKQAMLYKWIWLIEFAFEEWL